MCTFITIVLPAHADRAALETRLRAHRRRLCPQDDTGLARQLTSDEAPFVTTWGHCDCGTPLGLMAPASGASAGKAASMAERMRRKGWIEAKIGRALAQRDAADVRDARIQADRAASPMRSHACARTWCT